LADAESRWRRLDVLDWLNHPVLVWVADRAKLAFKHK
jgi:hypothetical protein